MSVVSVGIFHQRSFMDVIVWSPRLGLSGIVQDGLSEGGRGEKWGRWEGASEGRNPVITG